MSFVNKNKPSKPAAPPAEIRTGRRFAGALSAVKNAASIEDRVLDQALVQAREAVADSIQKGLDKFAVSIAAGRKKANDKLTIRNLATEKKFKPEGELAAAQYKNRKVDTLLKMATRARTDASFRMKFQKRVWEPIVADLRAEGFVDPQFKWKHKKEKFHDNYRWHERFVSSFELSLSAPA
jgi:hypothetical protein